MDYIDTSPNTNLFYKKNKDHRKTYTSLPTSSRYSQRQLSIFPSLDLKKAEFPSGIFIKPKDQLQSKMNYYYNPYTSETHYESFMKFDKNKDYDPKDKNKWSSVKDLIFMPET